MFTTASAYAITIHFPFKARYRPQPIPGHEPIFLYDGPYAGLAIRWRSVVTELQAACWSFSVAATGLLATTEPRPTCRGLFTQFDFREMRGRPFGHHVNRPLKARPTIFL